MMSLASQGVRRVDPTPSCSEFHSARIESMIASRSEFDTELEFRIAHSKVHWSELTSASGNEENEESVEDHLRDFVELQKDAHWGSFCNEVADVVLGKKLGEGAQADVYEAQVTFVKKNYNWTNKFEYVVKVMKADCGLADLQRQWPRGLGLLTRDVSFLYGALVKDLGTQRNQFCFVMRRYWGDLRTLIDLRMEHKNVGDPPFTAAQAKWFMVWIANWMSILHKMGIIHRDLKASNVLVSETKIRDQVSSNDCDTSLYVADYECSIGVVGTGFWRAPEIFQQLRNKVPSSKMEFTEKVDVYSFAMTCYEIVTGLIPFEGLPNTETQDAILNGARPELPQNLDPKIREIITSCWNPNPSLRPSFQDLYMKVKIIACQEV